MLCFLVLETVVPSACQNPASVAGITVSMYVKIDRTPALFDAGSIVEIQDFFSGEVIAACGKIDCGMSASKVIVTVSPSGTENIDGGYEIGIEINILLPDNGYTMLVKRSSRLTKSNIEARLLDDMILPGFSLLAYSDTYRMDEDRTALCGDSILHPSEVCDDGNTDDGDGCTGICTLEDGYMCFGAWRDPLNPLSRGKMTSWDTDVFLVSTLTILPADEVCLGHDIDVQDSQIFDPEQWQHKYQNLIFPNTLLPLPPAGYFGKRFCTQTFPAPDLYEFNDSCVPELSVS